MSRKTTEARQAEIVDAALRIIAARGVGALTVSSLAGELGLTGAALYRHFASTDAILEAVATHAAAALDASTPPLDLPARTWLLRLAEQRTATVGDHAGLSRLLLSDQFALALPPAALAALTGAVQRTREGIVRALTAGQAAGDIRGDIAPQALAPIVMGTIQMIALHRAGPMLPRAEGDPMRFFHSLLALLAPPR